MCVNFETTVWIIHFFKIIHFLDADTFGVLYLA